MPKELVASVGRKEIVKSLRTRDRKDAEERYHSVRGDLVREARISQDQIDNLSEEQLLRAVQQWLDEREAEFVGNAFEASEAMSQTERVIDAQQQLDALIDFEEEESAGTIQEWADQILRRCGMSDEDHTISALGFVKPVSRTDKSSEKYQYLCDLVIRAESERLRRYTKDLKGKRTDAVDPLFAPSTNSSVQKSKQNSPSASDSALTLDDIFDRWCVETGSARHYAFAPVTTMAKMQGSS